MNSQIKVLLMVGLLATQIWGGAFKQLIELNDPARSWVAQDGRPLFYTSASGIYSIENKTVNLLSSFDPKAAISLSPAADYRLLSLLQNPAEIKDGQRYADYFVLDDQNELQYKLGRGSSADLKPLVSGVSDSGILALADPVQAHLYLYREGRLISDSQLFETEGDYSLERKLRLQWVGDYCYIMLERPGINGSPARAVLFIKVNADGRGQETSILPITYLQDYVFRNGRLFISGYNYSASDQQMQPLIIEVSDAGQVLWTNANFGHELTLSQNGEYLAALSSHEAIQLFDLKQERVREIIYEHDNKVSLGLSVNNAGDVAVIRVPVDFFVKRNTYFAEIYQPLVNRSTSIQIDPRFPKLFQLHSDGEHFYLGTNYEWIELP